MNTDQSQNYGYSLVELLVVIALLAAIATFAVPSVAHTVEIANTQSDLRSLIIDLRRLENEAVVKQKTISIFEQSTGKIEISAGDSLILPHGSVVDFPAGSGRIDFFPDGTSTGGVLRVTHGAYPALVSVTWLSGDVATAEGSQ